jgi:hypothetical protein
MQHIIKAATVCLIVSGTTAIAGAPPPKQYSIVEVVQESRACRPAFSNNCMTLKKGERVAVLAWQITDNPRRGLYCLRPVNMDQCYYADLTAIEINGVPVPTVGMDKIPEEKPITAEDCKPLPQGIEGLKTTTMGQLQRHQKCLDMLAANMAKAIGAKEPRLRCAVIDSPRILWLHATDMPSSAVTGHVRPGDYVLIDELGTYWPDRQNIQRWDVALIVKGINEEQGQGWLRAIATIVLRPMDHCLPMVSSNLMPK